uniref:Uncharacterized protein n=1 Tax=viral metagenome TaxID=1070528 RepID=A0A6C0M338_9ZZZZ
MNFNKARDLLKQTIKTLFNVKPIEKFTLPPYEEPSALELQMFQKYQIIPREIYDVLLKFEVSVTNLSTSEYNLRKKYLQIIKTIVNDNFNVIKTTLESNPDIQLVNDNMESLKELLIYMINLMINDIERINNPQIDCPKSNCPKSRTIIYLIIITILVIGIVTLLIMRK